MIAVDTDGDGEAIDKVVEGVIVSELVKDFVEVGLRVSVVAPGGGSKRASTQ